MPSTMVLESKEIIEQRKRYYALSRELCHPDNRAGLEALLKVIESEGNVDGGVAHGLPWRIHRNGMGQWCGYVGVYHDHPAYGMGSESDDDHLSCHGGVTFSGKVPEWGHGDLWWIGFDTAHAWDLQPFDFAMPSDPPVIGVYKDKAYTIAECEKLAMQLVQMEQERALCGKETKH